MWNKRKDEDYTPKPAQAMPAQAESRKEGLPLSTMSMRDTEFETSRGSATIGKSVTIKGEIYSREDLVVDGEVEGSIELTEHRLTIGPNGKLRAGVKAREIVVLGTINGNVEALDKIDIRKDARLVGDIKTARIIIEDGAYFKGSIDIVKQEPPKVTQSARAPQVASQAGVQPSPVSTNSLK
ncbi:MAG: polymer-forming cytoskeletal protein [Bryobacteraceae bacterium]